MECSGACVNLQTNASNCGTCGHSCGANGTCSGGSCVCGAGAGLCGGTCVDQMTDTSACGANCTNCNNLPFVNGPYCDNGSCNYQSCSGPWVNCSGNPADGCPCRVVGMGNQCNNDGTCKQT